MRGSVPCSRNPYSTILPVGENISFGDVEYLNDSERIERAATYIPLLDEAVLGEAEWIAWER